ncbi:MAG: penicillin acylase family protein, partial [Pyrinomonadaceae bacterium]
KGKGKGKGQCREMTTFDAGSVGSGAGTPVVFNETVHGPVIGYATVDGERVALSSARTTRNRELMSAFGFAKLNEGSVHDVESFFDAANDIEMTFNWFYADKDDIAMFSGGRLPVRHPQVDLGLPTWGSGKYEWRGFLSQDKHPHGTAPADGTILNWNNKPVAGWQAADDTWTYGSVHRNELLEGAVDHVSGGGDLSLADTVAAMNYAATQDLRIVESFKGIEAVLGRGGAPSARAQQMLDILRDWRDQGGSRLDVDLDGKIDHPGAAIMDRAWTKIADAVMGPVLGPQLDDLASLMSRDNRPSSQGSAYGGGWYGYVEKDLRTIAGLPVTGRFNTRFCGGNTATILPNESYLARRYGRTILLRANIMRNPDLSGASINNFQVAVASDHKDELTADGNFYRTLWHEVGHYLGVDRTRDDRDLDEALQDDSSLLEEMKADLVSLFVAEALHKQGYYTDGQLRSVYAGGILRVIQNNKPRRDQPYNTMQLMQWNFYLEHGLLSFDPASKKMTVNYGKYHEVVGKLLAKVLAVQYAGDKAAADQFVDEYTRWDENLHGVIAKNQRDQQRYRFRLFKYGALGE